jgi:N-acetylgalactosamine-6-sulfatase
VLARLDELGLASNTIVVFSSDNGPEDIHIANAGHSGVGSPGPLRGRKRSLYEGGIRVPLLARWPGRIPAARVDSKSVVSAVDFLPSFSRLCGAALPNSWRLDGEDVSETLLGNSAPRRKPLQWEWRFQIADHVWFRSPMLAIRDGQWKLLMNPDGSRAELYDIPRDPSEMNNVAAASQALVRRLSERVLAWHRTLPPGPSDPDAGKHDYPWPRD